MLSTEILNGLEETELALTVAARKLMSEGVAIEAADMLAVTLMGVENPAEELSPGAGQVGSLTIRMLAYIREVRRLQELVEALLDADELAIP